MPTMQSAAILRRWQLPRADRVRMTAIVFAGSAFTAVCARLSLPLPFSPVPITGQSLAVLLVGAVLGARAGGLAMVCYLGEGAIGLPVFAGGTGGPAVLAGATAGYLWAFPAAAFVAGAIIDRLHGRQSAAVTLLALVLADAVVFAGGVPWLGSFLHIGPARAADLGLWPYVPGDLAKVVLVAMAVSSGRNVLSRAGVGTGLR
jgi:biotin transport system substrate-specific component